MESARTKARRESRKQTKINFSPDLSNSLKSVNSDFIIWAVDRKTGHVLMIPSSTRRLKNLNERLRSAGATQDAVSQELNETIRRPEVRVEVQKELYGLNEKHETVEVQSTDLDSPLSEFTMMVQGWVSFTVSQALGDSNFACMSFDFDNSNHATLYGTATCPDLSNSQMFGWFLTSEIMASLPTAKRASLMSDLAPGVRENIEGIMAMIKK